MKATVRTVDAVTRVVELQGELDLYSAAGVNATLDRVIDDHQCLTLVVDIRGVTAVDFSTLALLSQNGRRLRTRRGRLEVLCPPNGGIGQLLSKASESWGDFDVRVEAT